MAENKNELLTTRRSYTPLQYSGPCNSVNYLGHSKNISWWWWWWWWWWLCT